MVNVAFRFRIYLIFRIFFALGNFVKKSTNRDGSIDFLGGPSIATQVGGLQLWPTPYYFIVTAPVSDFCFTTDF